jgi:basic membrane protein A
MKRVLALAVSLVLAVGLLSACAPTAEGLKVGFITDGGALDDGNVNQVMWNALISLRDGVGLSIASRVPEDREPDTLMAAVRGLANDGCNMIVMADPIFAGIVEDAQILYRDCQFVALDFTPDTLGDTAVSVAFASQEAGFMAGFATAIRLQNARTGALLGEEDDPWRAYSYGFQQGLQYANENYGTAVTLAAADVHYLADTEDANLAQQAAAVFYDRGGQCLFVACGRAGAGAITEAKLRRANGADIWAVGSQYNQFVRGTYDGNNSVVITTAVKRWADAVIDVVDLARLGRFPGGQVLTYDAENGGVGMPSGEANLTVEMRKTCEDVYEMLQNGDISVTFAHVDGLIE